MGASIKNCLRLFQGCGLKGHSTDLVLQVHKVGGLRVRFFLKMVKIEATEPEIR